MKLKVPSALLPAFPLLASSLLAGCSGIHVSQGPGLTPAPQIDGSANRIAANAPVSVSVNGQCMLTDTSMSGYKNGEKISSGLLTRATEQLRQEGYAVSDGSTPHYRMTISYACNSHNFLGFWPYILTLGILPAWNDSALIIDTSLYDPNGRLIGMSKQTHGISSAMSLWSPLGLLWGQLSPEDVSRVADLSLSHQFAISRQ